MTNAIRIAETVKGGVSRLTMMWAGHSYTVEPVGMIQRAVLGALERSAAGVVWGTDPARNNQVLALLNTDELYPTVLGSSLKAMRSDHVPAPVMKDMLGIAFQFHVNGFKAATLIVQRLDQGEARHVS